MPKEILEKKLEQIRALIDELGMLLKKPEEDFVKDTVVIRAAERDFQLIIDSASDINAHLLIERGKKTPDTYRQSFIDLGNEGIISRQLADVLAISARLRNILVHEYDFEEDYVRFYREAKKFLPYLEEYAKAIAAMG